MGAVTVGFLRFFLLAFSFWALQGSSIIRTVERLDPERLLAEYQLYRKSRLASLEIPKKSELWMDHPELLVNLEPYLRQEIPDLALYNAPRVRNALIDFFVEIAGDEEIAVYTLYYANLYGVPPLLAFSVAYYESRFRREAVNQNPGSIDRGVFQLNSRSFPQLREEDFFNIDINIKNGIRYLQWCLSVTNSTYEALGAYNAGLSRVRRGEYPATTLVYIRRIQEFRENLEQDLYAYLQRNLPVMPESAGG